MDLSSSIRRFADYLDQVGLDLSAYDMLDLLWLALRRAADVGQPPAIESEATSVSASMPSPDTPSPPVNDPGDTQHSGGIMAGNRTFPLHADQPNPDLDTGRLPLVVPLPPVLPAKLELVRVLRPLRRWVPLHHRQELDEAASVQRIAETGSWLPVLRPQTNRWLDVVLVVDTAPAMLIWQRTINELQRVLERSGVFRDVRRWHLGTDNPDTIYLAPMGAPNGAPSRNPREMIDPNGCRLILVVSDFVAPAWHAHPITHMLASLAAKSSLALIQVLPYRLWERSALGRHPEAILRARWPNTPSAQLLFQPVRRSFRTRISGVPVPVAGLDVESVATLAQLVAGRTQTQQGGVLLQTISAPFVPADKVLGVEELLANWKLHAAEESIQLLRALAVVPLSAPIMHLIHHQSVAVPRLEQMAEVLLSGLIRRDPTAPAGDAVTYRFIDGAREILQRELPVGLGLGLLRRTSEYIATCDGQPNHFRAMLVGSASIDDAALQAINPAFATIAASYLKRLGGRYAEIGQRMEGHEAEDSPLNSEILTHRLGNGSGSRTSKPISPNPQRNPYFSISSPLRSQPAWIPELVHIPAGPFLMGSSNDDTLANDDEKPQHRLELPEFWIGKTPVTNAQFRPFVEGDGYTNRAYWTHVGWQWREQKHIITPGFWDDVKWNGDDYPVVGVSWFEAVAYCRWLSAQTKRAFRLPTEAEWEKAARGPDGCIWPWGNTWKDGCCNSEEAGLGRTTPVGQYSSGASPYDVLDMAGNVYEWCATQWKKSYPYQIEDEWLNAYLEPGEWRMIRGGGWFSGRKYVRGAFRTNRLSYPRARNYVLGLRVASRAFPVPF